MTATTARVSTRRRAQGGGVALAVTMLVASGLVLAAPAAADEPPTENCDQIAFSAQGSSVFVPPSSFEFPNDVYIAEADGASTTVIPRSDGLYNQFPQWAPDGSKLMYYALDGTEPWTPRLYTADADGAGRTRITNAANPRMEPSWGPESDELVYLDAAGDTGPIERTAADGSGSATSVVTITARSFLPRTEPIGLGVHDANPRLNSTGDRLAYITWAGGLNYRLGIRTLSNGQTTTLGTGTSVVEFAWSPDGTKIAWIAGSTTGQFGTNEAYVANADGSGQVHMSRDIGGTDPQANQFLTWAPDSSKIAWEANDGPGGDRRIWMTDGDGTNRVEVSAASPNQNMTNPQFSPASDKIAWAESVTGVGPMVTVADLAGTILGRPVQGFEPEWSPDGDRIATRFGVINIAFLDGSGLVTISVPGASLYDHTWRPCADPRPFRDIRSSFARDDILLVAFLGITGGLTPGRYGPGELVSREQMAAFIARTWRALGNDCPTGVANPFTDIGASFAQADILCILGLGITGGITATEYGPLLPVTREQMAAFLARFWRAVGGTCPSPPDPFTDIGASFARTDILCILGLGITGGITPTAYGPLFDVTREQMAAFLARTYRAATK